MNIIAALILSFIAGIVSTIIFQSIKKHDGRLVIDGNDYFVAITTKPEELDKKRFIQLKVVTK